jgi:hypothetical protein
VRRRSFLLLLSVLVPTLLLGLVGTASATPGKTTACLGCHDLSASVHVTATLVSATAATSLYSIAVDNPYGSNGWAVFQGTGKIAGAAGSGSNVTLTNGVAYTIYGVSGNGNGTQGFATISVTPSVPSPNPNPNPTPTPDTTAPTTTSNAQATYAGSAAIKLTAIDNAGGSGVAHTYYVLDTAPQAEGTSVGTSVLGAHTLEFWSVDASGNAESPHKSVGFTVAAAPVVTSYTYSYKFKLKKGQYKSAKATLKNSATGKSYTVKLSKKGVATFKNIPGGKYRLSAKAKGHFKFKAKTVWVGPKVEHEND